MSEEPKSGDEHMGTYVYCTQHLRVHRTGWCTVDPRDKVSLKSTSLEAANKEWQEHEHANDQ